MADSGPKAVLTLLSDPLCVGLLDDGLQSTMLYGPLSWMLERTRNLNGKPNITNAPPVKVLIQVHRYK